MNGPSMKDPDAATIDFECPRCAAPTTDAYYGPCPICRRTLREQLRGEQRDDVAAAYEPKMNVTPNAVALKE